MAAALERHRKSVEEPELDVEQQEADLLHVVILPNYKEDLSLLAETLLSLAQASCSKSLVVVLAMEEREGPSASQKTKQLVWQFGSCFRTLFSTSHPPDLVQLHLDGTSDHEVPGKASNLKWAVRKTYDMLLKESLDMEHVMLTVADADVLFHPGYFTELSREFTTIKARGGSQHQWTMWQAPQLPFRNYYEAPACSRVWAYVASVYECGCTLALGYGNDHIVFSTYSLPLQLAIDAEAHEGDVIAEDHHAYFKCFYYSARISALQAISSNDADACCRPLLQLRPMYLPVKATSVVSEDGTWQTWIDRWFQAKRHAQGVAELSFAVLAAYDTFTQLPFHMYSFKLIVSIWRFVVKLLWVHVLPPCQFCGMVALVLHWLINGSQVPSCSDVSSFRQTALCGFAGVWVPTWPSFVPIALIIVSSYQLVWTAFLKPSKALQEAGKGKSSSIWSSEDAHIPPTCGSSATTLLGLVLFDCLVFTGILVLPYGIAVEVLAFWSVFLRGNRFEYVTATKATAKSAEIQAMPLLQKQKDYEDEGYASS